LLRENFKILWVAQSSELCTQAFETFKYIYDKKGTHKMKIGHYYGGFDNVNEEIINSPAIIFCGIQKLLSNYQHDIWTKIKNETYLVIIDEAHRSVAQQWVNALNYFVDNVNVNLLGLTATPGLGAGGDDTYRLATYYNNCKITLLDSNYAQENNPIQTLTEQGFLAKIKRFNVDNIFDDNDPLATVGEDTNGNIVIAKRSLNYLSKLPSRNRSIINIIKDANVQNKKMLVFTCSVAHNKILQYLLREEGIHAESIDANTKNREQIIEAFKNGDLNILLNFGVLTTGFDAPKTNVCIIARPIESIVMYSQMVGRILRGPLNGKGNNENELYTIRDNFKLGAYENLFTSFDEFYK
jgi:superfamily II DNA or RNA helicase